METKTVKLESELFHLAFTFSNVLCYSFSYLHFSFFWTFGPMNTWRGGVAISRRDVFCPSKGLTDFQSCLFFATTIWKVGKAK